MSFQYGSCCEVFMPTWYPTVVAMVRITTTKVIAAWLAIVELLKILVHVELNKCKKIRIPHNPNVNLNIIDDTYFDDMDEQ